MNTILTHSNISPLATAEPLVPLDLLEHAVEVDLGVPRPLPLLLLLPQRLRPPLPPLDDGVEAEVDAHAQHKAEGEEDEHHVVDVGQTLQEDVAVAKGGRGLECKWNFIFFKNGIMGFYCIVFNVLYRNCSREWIQS